MTHAEQTTVDAIMDLLREQEKHRVELRKQDDHWRERMEGKTDKLFHCVDDLATRLGEVPCIMDEKIAACRDDRVEATGEAVRFATQAEDFLVVLLKLAAAAGVITGAVFGVGKLFGWL